VVLALSPAAAPPPLGAVLFGKSQLKRPSRPLVFHDPVPTADAGNAEIEPAAVATLAIGEELKFPGGSGVGKTPYESLRTESVTHVS